MSQLRQYLSASSLREPFEAVVELFPGVVPVVAVTVGIVGGAGDAACIRMCRFNETFLSALYEQCGQA